MASDAEVPISAGEPVEVARIPEPRRQSIYQFLEQSHHQSLPLASPATWATRPECPLRLPGHGTEATQKSVGGGWGWMSIANVSLSLHVHVIAEFLP